MICKGLMTLAIFAALMAVPALGQQMIDNQTAVMQTSPTAPGTGMLNATPGQEVARGINVNITNISFMGDEWVAISNQGDAPVNLNGWVLTDDVEFRYVFPPQTLSARSFVRIHPGHGFNAGADIYLGLPGEMLDDTGDIITLYDSSGAVVSRFAYPGAAQAQQILPPIESAVPGTIGQPLGQAQRGLLLQPGEFTPAARGEQIRTNATSTYVTQLANVSEIFGANESENINITDVAVAGDEFIEITNEGIVPMDLTGWTLTAGLDFSYTIPAAVLPVDASLRIHPGMGTSTQTDLYLNLDRPMLNDTAATIRLLDPQGAVISTYAYPVAAGDQQGIAAPGMVRAPGTQPILVSPPGSAPASGAVATPTPTTGEAFLAAPVPALPGAAGGQIQQVISGQPENEIIGEPIVGGAV